MLIAIPSMGRSNGSATFEILKKESPMFFVPEREHAEYKKNYKDVTAVPNEIKGITQTRNFILDWCKAKNIEHVVQVDDDAIGFFKFENCKIFDISYSAAIHFHSAMQLMEDLGTVLFGFQVTKDTMTYREYSPFSFVSTCVASCFGMKVCNLRFDENIRLKEDYDYSLQVMREYRKVLRLNKYVWFVEHQKNKGGCSEYRSHEAELNAINYLKKKWGDSVIQTNKRKDFEIVVRSGLRGI